MKFSVGEKIKQRYISDHDIHNNMVATILDIWDINFYPNGDYSVVEKRQQAEIQYDNGDITYAIVDFESCGVASPFEKVRYR